MRPRRRGGRRSWRPQSTRPGNAASSRPASRTALRRSRRRTTSGSRRARGRAPRAGAAELFDAFLQRKDGASKLAAALADKKLAADAAKVGVRAVRTSGRDAPALIEALTKAGGLTFGARTLTADELKQMVADVAKQ